MEISIGHSYDQQYVWGSSINNRTLTYDDDGLVTSIQCGAVARTPSTISFASPANTARQDRTPPNMLGGPALTPISTDKNNKLRAYVFVCSVVTYLLLGNILYRVRFFHVCVQERATITHEPANNLHHIF